MLKALTRRLVAIVLGATFCAFAAPVAATPAPYADDHILVCLEQAIPGQRFDGSFPLATGTPAVDRLIREARVWSIESALRVSASTPGRVEARQQLGLDRTYRFYIPRGADVRQLAERFAALPGVDFAEPDYIGQGGGAPNDPRFNDQWGLQQVSDADVDAPEAWDIAVGEPLLIAVLDTGVDSGHEDLRPKIVPGFDFVNNDTDAGDDNGHGSNVSSILAAATNNGVGVAGGCWNCRILPLKVLDDQNNGFYSWWADAMGYAADNGARAINISAGGVSPSQTLLNGVIYAYQAGVSIVSITHNDDANLVRYPGAYPHTITVGATDELDRRADPFCYSASSGSNYGNEIDVVAPGELILGAAMNGGYNLWCGTSQAAPLVAGLDGIIRSIYPSVGREGVRHLISSGAEDQVGRVAEDVAGFDIYHGWGRVNMDRTLEATVAEMSLHVDGKAATRVFFQTPNALASSYDFIRGDLASLSETSGGVDAGTVVCLENDSADASTAGNEDTDTPAPGAAFIYLGRFNSFVGAGRYGGSTLNRDRNAALGDCAL